MPRILLVEDDATLREEMMTWLEFEGYRTTAAATGRQGLEAVEFTSYDLVVSDIMMPDMDGLELLTALRGRTDTHLLPVIFVTARAERSDVRLGMQLGADDYITKPFTRAELLQAVATRLARQEEQQRQMDESLAALQRVLHYTLPHELRTPLSGILGFAELLLDVEELSRDELREMAELIQHSGMRLHRLVENYLLYAQIELMRHDGEKTQLLRAARYDGANTTVQRVAEQIAAKYNRADDLQLYLEECNPLLSISGEDWEKIATEVIDNAFKFSHPGSVVMIGAGLGGGEYLLSVQDHGRGMSAEQVRQVAAYVQFDRKIYEQQGLGLGLTIARSLAELYAGSLHIQSRPEAGARVFVRLPLPPDQIP
jgi:DNA-binding response OmpR family regulator/anti-sigma regulatory factor (Ser/Thr protein kinase)